MHLCKFYVIIDTYCSVDLEFLIIKCRPFYLPREFTCIVAAAVYVPPDANAKMAIKELQLVSCKPCIRMGPLLSLGILITAL